MVWLEKVMFMRRIGNIVKSHVRDINVFHTVDSRVFFEIPLYGEKNLEILHIEVTDDNIRIKTRVRTKDEPLQKPSTSDCLK